MDLVIIAYFCTDKTADTMKIVRNRFIPSKNFAAINLFGILFCHPNTVVTAEMVNHERIHTRQMLEMCIIFFYLWYVTEWVVRLFLKGDAYMNLSFEREAYLYENDFEYLKHRPLFAWWPLRKRENWIVQKYNQQSLHNDERKRHDATARERIPGVE